MRGRSNPKVEMRKEGARWRLYVDGSPTSTTVGSKAEGDQLIQQAFQAFGLDQNGNPKSVQPVVRPVQPAARPAAQPRVTPLPARGAPAPAAQPTAPRSVPATKGHAPAKIDLSVMLAHTWKNESPVGWWASEKLNGVRAYWTGSGMYSRQGNRIDLPSWFEAHLPAGVALDGELWVGRGKDALQQMVSIKAHSSDPRWRQVSYMVFDAPDVPGPVEARWKQAAACQSGPVKYVEQAKISSAAELKGLLAKIEALGGEGLMLRRPGSRYARSRSNDLLKVKSTHDAEAVIIGYKPGKGRHEGRLGAYTCKFKHDPSIVFDVGTGLSDRDRDRPLKIGTVITVSWKMLTPDGKPHPASFEGARNYE